MVRLTGRFAFIQLSVLFVLMDNSISKLLDCVIDSFSAFNLRDLDMSGCSAGFILIGTECHDTGDGTQYRNLFHCTGNACVRICKSCNTYHKGCSSSTDAYNNFTCFHNPTVLLPFLKPGLLDGSTDSRFQFFRHRDRIIFVFDILHIYIPHRDPPSVNLTFSLRRLR